MRSAPCVVAGEDAFLNQREGSESHHDPEHAFFSRVIDAELAYRYVRLSLTVSSYRHGRVCQVEIVGQAAGMRGQPQAERHAYCCVCGLWFTSG